MNNLLKKTYLGNRYENTLFNFLENIIKEIAFDSEQLNEINVVLQEHKSRKNENKLKTANIKDFLASLNIVFNKQNSLYGQYKVILDNKEEIFNLIEKANINDSKDESGTSRIRTSINLTERPLAPQPQSELLEIKPKVQQSKFEVLLINAFKKLVGFNEPKQEKKKASKAEEEIHKVNSCEEELRNALEELKQVQNAFVNKNIIDKISRINKKNRINLSLLIGQIYIELMNKKKYFR